MYNILELIGCDEAITPENGTRIYNFIHNDLVLKKNVEIDFSGIKAISGPFINAAFGKLFVDIPTEEMATLIKFDNFPSSDSEMFFVSRLNAANLYHNNPKYKKVIKEEKKAESD